MVAVEPSTWTLVLGGSFIVLNFNFSSNAPIGDEAKRTKAMNPILAFLEIINGTIVRTGTDGKWVLSKASYLVPVETVRATRIPAAGAGLDIITHEQLNHWARI